MVPGDRRHTSTSGTRGLGISMGENRSMGLPGQPGDSPQVERSDNEEKNVTPEEQGDLPPLGASSNCPATVEASSTPNQAVATEDVDEAVLHTLPSGEVGRRAPANPLHAPVLEKLGLNKGRKRRRKVKDPKLMNNPLRGRLVVCISTTALLLWLFFWEMIYNYTSFNGRCVSLVQYPDYKLNKADDRAPMVIRYGYGACQYNLGDLAYPRVGVGSKASDLGWPKNLVKNGSAGSSSTSWDSPNGRILTAFGGLETNYIRNYDELWRIFTSMYLHGGFLHITINLLCQIQTLWMLEPDWGLWRTALLFFVGGVSGNLLSAVADPCNITVGSSGAMYGLMGALIPYCVEYWKTIPRPCCILVFFIIVLIIGILTGMSGFTDNYAHIGGCVGGILYGFATITTVSACDKCTLGERLATTKPFSYCISKETQRKLLEAAQARKKQAMDRRRQEVRAKRKAGGARGKAIRVVKDGLAEQGRPPCKMAPREWVVRITCGAALCAFWVALFCVLLVKDIYDDYSPPGQLKFEGWLYCKCGTIVYEARQTTWNKGMYWCFGNDQDANFYLTP